MKGIALGTIVIDSDYNVVDFNEPVQKLIPTMVKNEKCYKALLGKEEPCTFCPVIRKQDCVVALPDSNTESMLEIALPNGRSQHVLSFLINDQRYQPALNCLKYNLIIKENIPLNTNPVIDSIFKVYVYMFSSFQL